MHSATLIIFACLALTTYGEELPWSGALTTTGTAPVIGDDGDGIPCELVNVPFGNRNESGTCRAKDLCGKGYPVGYGPDWQSNYEVCANAGGGCCQILAAAMQNAITRDGSLYSESKLEVFKAMARRYHNHGSANGSYDETD
jgi:hypothetical protein